MGYQLNTDFSNVAPDEGGNSLRMFPPSDSRGWLVQIVESDGKETTEKTGVRLAIVLQGLEGPVNGKFMDWSVNVANPSQKAVEIGHAQMSAIAHVTGHIRVGNSAEWHNKPFRVVVEPDNKADLEKYPNSVRIAKILDLNGNSAKDAGKGPMQGAGNFQQQQPQAPTQQQNWGGQQQGQNSFQQNGGNGSQGAQNAGSSFGGGQQGGFNPQQNGAQAQQFGQQPQNGQFGGQGQFQQQNGSGGPGWNQ